jgi:ribose 5-phosphate isomerase RpiB
MRVGIATDHGGFGLKEELVTHLRAAAHSSSTPVTTSTNSKNQ